MLPLRLLARHRFAMLLPAGGGPTRDVPTRDGLRCGRDRRGAPRRGLHWRGLHWRGLQWGGHARVLLARHSQRLLGVLWRHAGPGGRPALGG